MTYRQFLASPQWLVLRVEILKRDEYRCSYCRRRDGTLDVHHVQPVSRRWDLRLDPDNLLVLCRECHRGVHDGAPFLGEQPTPQMCFDFYRVPVLLQPDCGDRVA